MLLFTAGFDLDARLSVFIRLFVRSHIQTHVQNIQMARMTEADIMMLFGRH